MNGTDDARFMREALREAYSGMRSGNGEVGVVVVDGGGSIVFRGFNAMNATLDATGHAEMTALRAVSKQRQDLRLHGVTLYSTLEPCGMCTCACAWAQIDRIVYGAGHLDVPEEYFELDGLWSSDILRHAKHAPKLLGGVLREECTALYFHPDRVRR